MGRLSLPTMTLNLAASEHHHESLTVSAYRVIDPDELGQPFK